MPASTVTQRELRNKSSGVDLSVPTHKVIPGRITDTIEYNVVVVSRLQCFKLPKHKETDVVQFALPKQYSEFETFRKCLSQKFSGTVLPTLPSTMLSFSDTNVKARRNALDSLMKLVASTPRLVACSYTLEFLGVNPITASNFRLDEQQSVSPSKEATAVATDIFEEQRDGQDKSQSLFGEAGEENLEEGVKEEEEGDLFASSSKAATVSEDIYFGGGNSAAENTTKMFAAQDLEGQAYEDDPEFFVPGAWEPEKRNIEIEDNTDLLTIEDDLDNLLLQKPKKSDRTQPVQPESAKPTSSSSTIDQKQNPRPPLKPKPALKPKPGLAPKPGAAKPTKTSKSAAAASVKPDDDDDDLFSLETDKTNTAAMDAGDILKYIQQNQSGDAEVDLFS